MKRPHAKYFTRREAYNIAASAYEAGIARGQQKEADTHWHGNGRATSTDPEAFDQWREQNYPNLPAI